MVPKTIRSRVLQPMELGSYEPTLGKSDYRTLFHVPFHFWATNRALCWYVSVYIGHKKGQEWGSTEAFFNDRDGFVAPFSVVFGLQVLVYLCYFIVILNNEDLTKRWNKVFNTLTLFGVSLFVFFLIVRIGAIMGSSYYPAYIIFLNLALQQTVPT